MNLLLISRQKSKAKVQVLQGTAKAARFLLSPWDCEQLTEDTLFRVIYQYFQTPCSSEAQKRCFCSHVLFNSDWTVSSLNKRLLKTLFILLKLEILKLHFSLGIKLFTQYSILSWGYCLRWMIFNLRCTSQSLPVPEDGFNPLKILTSWFDWLPPK